jgi:hypothetical protein
MRSYPLSRTKPRSEPLAESSPGIPVLETANLPADEDWVLMESWRLDQADFEDVSGDTEQGTPLAIGVSALD